MELEQIKIKSTEVLRSITSTVGVKALSFQPKFSTQDPASLFKHASKPRKKRGNDVEG
jgi:hypothetical protein